MNFSQQSKRATANRFAVCVIAVILAGCNFYGYEKGQAYPHGTKGQADSAEPGSSTARTYPDQEQGDAVGVTDNSIDNSADIGNEDNAVTADEHGGYAADSAPDYTAPDYTPDYTAAGRATDKDGAAQYSANLCPESQVTELVLAAEYAQAQQLLEQILGNSNDEQRRSCTLTSMAYIAATPAAEFYNPQQALDYQSLARVNDSVQRGGLQLQLLDNTVSGLLASAQNSADPSAMATTAGKAVTGKESYQRSAADEKELRRLREELSKKDAALEKLKRLTLGDD